MPDTPVGTNSPDYTLVSGDLGANMYCKVTATNASGSANADSNTVGPVTSTTSTTTFDPAHTATTDVTLSGGNLTATNTTGTRGGTRSTTTGSGKKYFELLVPTIDTPAVFVVGIANATHALDIFSGSTLDGFGMALSGGVYSNNVVVLDLFLTFVAGDRICVAVDFAAEKIWFRQNGGPWNGAVADDDPTVGSVLDFSATNAGPYYAFVSLPGLNDVCTVNFGGTAYTHTPPSGYGNF